VCYPWLRAGRTLNEIVHGSELLEYEEWAVIGAAPLLIVAYLTAGWG